MVDASIVVEELSYRRPGSARPVFSKTSFRADAGSIMAIVGPNGSGKTTLLRLLAGLLPPTTGKVLIGDREPGGVRLLTEEPCLPGEQTVIWHVRFHALLYGATWQEAWSQTEEILEELGVSNSAGCRCRTLSRGTRQRVALARVLVGLPSVLLLDEPGSGLDEETQIAVRRRLRLHARGGGTVVMATHLPADSSLAGSSVLRLGRPTG